MTEKEFEQANELHDALRDANRILEVLHEDYSSYPNSYSNFRLKNDEDYSGFALTNGMLSVIKEALQSYRNKLAEEFEKL